MSGDRDLLERAARALREATPPSPDELLAARARLLAAHRAAGKSQRGRTLRWVLPLAAVLAAGTALAATPEALERVAHAVSSLFTPHSLDFARKHKRAPATPPKVTNSAAPVPQAAAPQIAAQTSAPAPGSAASPLPGSAVAAVVSEPTRPLNKRAPSAPVARTSRRARSAPFDTSGSERVEHPAPTSAIQEAPAVEPAPPPELAEDLDLARYRVAHQAHFRARDFNAALRGWDAYLAAYPGGTFAVEARYNRAICLVRLDRNGEARRALTPFADGEVAHGYRQAEAKKLLEALE